MQLQEEQGNFCTKFRKLWIAKSFQMETFQEFDEDHIAFCSKSFILILRKIETTANFDYISMFLLFSTVFCRKDGSFSFL